MHRFIMQLWFWSFWHANVRLLDHPISMAGLLLFIPQKSNVHSRVCLAITIDFLCLSLRKLQRSMWSKYGDFKLRVMSRRHYCSKNGRNQLITVYSQPSSPCDMKLFTLCMDMRVLSTPLWSEMMHGNNENSPVWQWITLYSISDQLHDGSAFHITCTLTLECSTFGVNHSDNHSRAILWLLPCDVTSCWWEEVMSLFILIIQSMLNVFCDNVSLEWPLTFWPGSLVTTWYGWPSITP